MKLYAVLIMVVAAVIAAGTGCDDDSGGASSATPLKIGLLLDFTGSPEASSDRQRGFDLALKHVNEGGGVLGMQVESVVADATGDPSAAVEAARRLVEVEGVHAIVGPNASSAALPVSESVSGPLRIPTISPSSSSPYLTDANDAGYFFRTALSDAIQGPVLAALAEKRGFNNVGLIYQDNPFGRGLADVFEASWDGTLRRVSIDRTQTDYLAELTQSAELGAQALVVIASEAQATAMVGQAIDEGIYDQFVFAGAAKRLSLVRQLGGDRLGGMYGTSSASDPNNAATADWEAAFIAEYGELPVLANIKETYDATIALAFAAAAAGSVDGAAVRDQLHEIAGPPGQTVLATPDGVANGLALLADGKEINLDGAANTLDWDENGDLLRGHIGIWRFTMDERIEEQEVVLVEK